MFRLCLALLAVGAAAAGANCAPGAVRLVAPQSGASVAPHSALVVEADDFPRGATRLSVVVGNASSSSAWSRDRGAPMALPLGTHAVRGVLTSEDHACETEAAHVTVECRLGSLVVRPGRSFEAQAAEHLAARGQSAEPWRVAALRDAVAVEHGLLCFAEGSGGASEPLWLPPGPVGWEAPFELSTLPRLATGVAMARNPPEHGQLSMARRYRGLDVPSTAMSALGGLHLEAVARLVYDLGARGVAGDTAVVDVQDGGAMVAVRGALRAAGLEQRLSWGTIAMQRPAAPASRPSQARWTASFDDLYKRIHSLGYSTPSLAMVKYNASRPGPAHGRWNEGVEMVRQRVSAADGLSFLRLATPGADCADVGAALEGLYASVNAGGVVVVDHFDDPQCRRVVADFRARHAVLEPLRPLGQRAAWWRVGGDDGGEWHAPTVFGNGLAFESRLVGPSEILDSAVLARVASPSGWTEMATVSVRDSPEALAAQLCGGGGGADAACVAHVLPQVEHHWLSAFLKAAAHLQLQLLPPEDMDFVEGHICAFRQKALVVARAARHSQVSQLCETGFNLGHSALLYLLANPSLKITAFDLGEHFYAPLARDALQQLFPGRLEVVFGDSTETVPRFQRERPDFRCNFISVDGGHDHDVPRLDIANMRAFANETYHVLVVDDALEPDVRSAWQGATAAGLAVEAAEVFSVFNSCWRTLEEPPYTEPCEMFDRWLVPDQHTAQSSIAVGSYL